ncbi:MAG: response regulator transcription factor [Lachnospiraceae bacterium]|nr:response regulator transcription factor [Lachnospiraceae bacterium]
MNTILIIEDDVDLVEDLQEALEDAGYQVCCAYTAKHGMELLRTKHIDLCLLDIRLPDGNGYEICKKMRHFFNGLIIMLTACCKEDEVVRGLQIGADDYVVKPFKLKELLARIERRLYNIGKLQRPTINHVLCSGELMIDLEHYQVWKNDCMLKLGSHEYHLIEKLVTNPNILITRENLIDYLWNNAYESANDTSLNTHICRLREKLGRYHGVSYIETVRGMGHRWVIPIVKN